MRVVLIEPQIPQNTGNIVRTCAVTGCSLTLVEPLGFRPTNKHLKRAGLDYWLGVDVQIEEHWNPEGDFWLFSSKAQQLYTEVSYKRNSSLVFGSETEGLPGEWLTRYADRCVKVPMAEGQRCLNLSTAVGIAIYEAKRQDDFSDLL